MARMERIRGGLAGGALLILAMPAICHADDAERARIARVTQPTTDFSKPEAFEARPGGAATLFGPFTHNAFSEPSTNMSFARRADFSVGNGIFRKVWVSAPSSTTSSDGLGPLFNARACQRCHLKDGRGHPPEAGRDDPALTMAFGISVPGAKGDGPDPTYGNQIQTFAIQGQRPEAQIRLSFEPVPVTFADGTVVRLQKPRWSLSQLRYGPVHPRAMISPRIAPQMIGVGLLEAIAESDIVAGADPDDRDGDGISGRARFTTDPETGKRAIGRFGWKADQPSVAAQASGAFAKDMGIATPLRPAPGGDCTAVQELCLKAPHGGSAGTTIEADQQMFDLVVFYARNLAVPARREPGDAKVLAGKKVFYESGCISCHRPKYVTRRMADRPEQSFQLIWPYSDLLLHDMGPGLADGRADGSPDPKADSSEWRTAPLWGIGLTKTVSGHTRYLHDGRARSVLEAVLWHGGEAETAKQRVLQLTKMEREALVAFLNSL